MADRPLEEIGLGRSAQTVLYLISLLPLVGLLIGFSYSLRRNTATRRLGRQVLFFAVSIHFLYACCLCPTLLVLAAG